MHELQNESRDSPRRHETSQLKNTSTDVSIVQKITSRLVDRIGTHRYDMWFRDTRFAVEQDRVKVSAANSFIARWIESNFTDDIRSAADAAFGKRSSDTSLQVDIVHVPVNGDANGSTQRPGDDAANPTAGRNGHAPDGEDLARSSRSDERPVRRRNSPRLRRLDDFVVSDTNRVAYGAARQLAEGKNNSHHSPLFLHGPCGVGKTHLLQGACRRYADLWRVSGSTVRYVTAEQFTNEYITAVRSGRIDDFRRRMRRLELLAIDDVHFLSSKERTQVEFLHTFDEISMSGARVIIASDSHPRQLRRLNKALVNRMLSGMIVQIELPDLDLRRRLSRKLAYERGLDITEQAIEMIASECAGSIRELEGAMNKLVALRATMQQHARVNGSPAAAAPSTNETGRDNEPIGMTMIQHLFGDQAHTTSSPVRMATIIDSVCERLAVSRSELLGNGRHKRVVLARSLISYLGKKLTTHSFPEIAVALGRPNHSTVHHANRRVCQQLESNALVELENSGKSIPLAELVNQLRQQIIRKHRE